MELHQVKRKVVMIKKIRLKQIVTYSNDSPPSTRRTARRVYIYIYIYTMIRNFTYLPYHPSVTPREWQSRLRACFARLFRVE